MKKLLILSFGVLMNACARQSTSIEPRQMHNPVAATPESIATGKKFFDRFCTSCHGMAGNGVSDFAKTLEEAGKPKPSDLTDDKWDYGSTDGDIFLEIRDGVGPNGAMKGLNGKPGIGPSEMWHIVNYVRSIGPKL